MIRTGCVKFLRNSQKNSLFSRTHGIFFINFGCYPILVAFFFLLGLFALPVFAIEETGVQSDQSTSTISLNDVISLVKKNNALLKQAHLQTSRAKEQVSIACTKSKPQIGTYLLGAHQLENPQVVFESGMLGVIPHLGAFPPNTVTYTESRRDSLYSLVSVNYPITQQRDIRTGIRMSKAALDLTEAKETQASIDLVCEAKKLYCTILALGNAQKANQSAIKLFTELGGTLEKLIGEGYAQKADLLNVRAKLAQVEAREESLRLKKTSLFETLNRLCGLAASTTLNLAPLPDPVCEAASDTFFSEAADMAVTNHPLIKQGQLQKKMAKLDENLKRGEFRPNLSLTVDRLQGHVSAEYFPKQISVAGLLLSWNPFDWGKRKHELESKKLAYRQADIALEETDRNLGETIRAAQRHVQETRAQLKAAAEKCVWADEQVRVFRNRLSEKAILPKDLLEAEAQLADVQFQQNQACLDVWVAQAEFEKALGKEP
ncbi:MAG: TolC family protein [Candidatus Riflebacteria bacterium]|nr:TolC family protein [Candidatus Riflebacteria bacterium]